MRPAIGWMTGLLALSVATIVTCVANTDAWALGPPVRVSNLVPRGSIDAAGLRRLSLEASRPAPRRGDEREPEKEFEPNEGEEPIIALGKARLTIPANAQGPMQAQSFGYTWPLRRSFRANRNDGDYPMDASLAVGPAHLVAMTNMRIVFYSKAGDSLAGATMDGFFPNGSQVPTLFDPRVEYDPGSGRFFAICLATGTTSNSAFEIAVSNSSDPTTGWTFYELANNLDANGIDYPYLGFGAGALYLAGNYRATVFGWPPPATTHWSGLWVIDKAALLSASTATSWQFIDFEAESKPVAVFPCARWSSTPSGIDDFMLAFVSPDGIHSRVVAYGVTLPGNWPAGAPTLDSHSYETSSTGSVPNAAQLGGPALLQANNLGAPCSLPLFINGHIHTALHAGSGSGMFIRHYDVDVSNWTSVTGTTDDFWDGSSFHYYPAATVNYWGEVGLVFTRSSSAEFASAHWTIRPQDESAYQADRLLKAGEAYYGTGMDNAATLYRWGDYNAAAVDPVSGGLWFINMYARGAVPRGSETWIGYVPHAVFADAGASSIFTGSPSHPWQTFLDGYNSAWSDNDLVLKAGSYHSGYGILNKPLKIVSDGGTATITP